MSVTFAFLWDFADLVDHWAAWAEGEVQQWPAADHAPFERALAGRPAIAAP